MVVLVVGSHGFRLKKRGGRLIVTYPDGSKYEVAVSKLSVVVISARGSLSTDVIRELAENNIPVVFSGGFSPYAVLHPFFMHATVLTRREQMRALDDDRGFHLAKAFCYATTLNKARVLRYFARSRERSDEDLALFLRDVAGRIEGFAEEINGLSGRLSSVRMRMMGIEGEAAKIYYDALKYLFPSDLGFHGRERRPPRDPVNSLLSYGYTILNSIVLLSIAKAGLEPFAGFLHTDRSGKPSLVLDISEEFRQPIVDVVVVSLFSRKRLSMSDFECTDEGYYYLSREGKSVFFDAFNKRLQAKAFPDGKVSFEAAIMRQVRDVARFVLGRISSYRPFIWRWG